MTDTKIPYRWLSIGFCEEFSGVDQAMGFVKGSFGYHSDEGTICYPVGDGSLYGVEDCPRYGPTYGDKTTTAYQDDPDVVGCGVDFGKRIAFFTLNGKKLGGRWLLIFIWLVPSYMFSHAVWTSELGSLSCDVFSDQEMLRKEVQG